jgi:hypothetical protein
MSDSMPTQTPPIANVTEQVCVPCQMPPVEAQSQKSATAQMEPTLLPPQSEGKTAGGVTAWQNSQKITALWSNNANRNVWAYVANVGWKKMADNSDSAVVAFNVLAAHAKLKGSTVNYRDEADGKVHEIYVW